MENHRLMTEDLLLIYTKKELVEKTGLDLATIYRLLDPRRKPSYWTYSKIETIHRENRRRIAAKKRVK